MAAFRAMNTDVTVLAPQLAPRDENALAREVALEFAVAEHRFSRFRPDSELSALNRAEGPELVSEEMLAVLRVARAFVWRTGGLFDPCVANALIAAGYDRSFAPGRLDREAACDAATPARFEDVSIDWTTRKVVLPTGVRLDFGGFVKGRTVDLAAARLAASVAIDAGGDARLCGSGPDGEGWTVDVEDPFDPARTVATLTLADCAVATSAPNRRRWLAGGLRMHHLIDPRTGRPAESDLAQVTVIAPTASAADVLAKTVFVLGASEGARWLETQGPDHGAVLVRLDGSVTFLGKAAVSHA